MSDTTLWYITDENQTFDGLNKKLTDSQFFKNSDNYPNFKISSLVESKELIISEKKAVFNIYEYSFDGPSSTRIKAMLIMFTFNNKLGFIVNKGGYANARAFLRELCGYRDNEKKTIVCEDYAEDILSGKLFLWMISKIYHKESDIEYEAGNEVEHITFDTLDSFKGDTKSGVNTVSTKGSDVITLLTTLAFLLESNRLTRVGLNISFGNHKNVKLNIGTHKKFISLDVVPEDYVGSLRENDSICVRDGKIDLTILRGALLLIVHLSLIPMLYSLYKSDSAGTNVKGDLISDISDDITERIKVLKASNDLEESDD